MPMHAEQPMICVSAWVKVAQVVCSCVPSVGLSILAGAGKGGPAKDSGG